MKENTFGMKLGFNLSLILNNFIRIMKLNIINLEMVLNEQTKQSV